MKRSWMLVLAFAAGCSSSPDPEEAPAAKPMPAARPASTREAQLSSLRSQLASKKADSAQADADLARIAAEREQLDGQPASQAKTNRLAEMATLEAGNKRKKQALGLDITDLENQVRDASAGTKSSGDDLAAALEEDAAVERQRVERRKAADQANRSDEARKVAAAEAGRKAEEEARAKEKIEGGRIAAAGADGPIFEERWMDAILKLREALQQFKRW